MSENCQRRATGTLPAHQLAMERSSTAEVGLMDLRCDSPRTGLARVCGKFQTPPPPGPSCSSRNSLRRLASRDARPRTTEDDGRSRPRALQKASASWQAASPHGHRKASACARRRGDGHRKASARAGGLKKTLWWERF